MQVIQSRVRDVKVLDIGARSESELLLLAGYGFSWENIFGLDLISYSPLVKDGDMHAIPYDDNEFDICISSRVLGYSNDMHVAINEMIRVLKPGGIIAINTGDVSIDDMNDHSRTTPGAAIRFSSLDDILELIGDSIKYIYLQHDPKHHVGEKKGSIVLIASISK